MEPFFKKIIKKYFKFIESIIIGFRRITAEWRQDREVILAVCEEMEMA